MEKLTRAAFCRNYDDDGGCDDDDDLHDNDHHDEGDDDDDDDNDDNEDNVNLAGGENFSLPPSPTELFSSLQ